MGAAGPALEMAGWFASGAISISLRVFTGEVLSDGWRASLVLR